MALFGARVPARRDVARIVSRTYTLARAQRTFSRASLVRARARRDISRGSEVRALGCLAVATASREAPVSTATDLR